MDRTAVTVLSLLCVLLVGCSAQPRGAAISFPHTVATVAPLQLTIDTAPDGIAFAVACVGDRPFRDVAVYFNTDHGSAEFDYGVNPEDDSPDCMHNSTAILKGVGIGSQDLETHEHLTVGLKVTYDNHTVETGATQFRIGPEGALYITTP